MHSLKKKNIIEWNATVTLYIQHIPTAVEASPLASTNFKFCQCLSLGSQFFFLPPLRHRPKNFQDRKSTFQKISRSPKKGEGEELRAALKDGLNVHRFLKNSPIRGWTFSEFFCSGKSVMNFGEFSAMVNLCSPSCRCAFVVMLLMYFLGKIHV
jgi:hypothetical protein